ncbi:hypothetical protein [Bdellovibrio sp. HCB337]|uniref:hypothetical protein n=1 Tax=Bdellovibrio sp. HCB337 TaxID=3394358 RepID=UPI0039A730A3
MDPMNQRGSGYLLMLISIMSIGLITYLINLVTPMLKYKEQIARDVLRDQVELVMMNLQANVENTQVLEASVNLTENQAIRCVANATCTATEQFLPLRLVNLEKAVISDGDSVGVDSQGQTCNVNLANPLCLVVLKISWRPLCPQDGSPCVNPSVEIQGRAEFSQFILAPPINLQKINFKRTVSNLSLLIK